MFVSDQRSNQTKPGDNQPMVFEHSTAAQRVLFGSDKAGEFLTAELGRLGSTRPMIITGGSAEQAAREITAQLEPVVERGGPARPGGARGEGACGGVGR